MVHLFRAHRKIALFIALVMVLHFSCNKEEVFYNHQAAPPQMKAIAFTDLKAGQHVDGVIHIEYSPEDTSTPFMGVALFVDSIAVTNSLYTNNGQPYIFDIDTRQWPEGLHLISFGDVKFKAPEIGMLALLMAPYKIHSIPLFFDRTPPTPVTVQSVTWDEAAKAPKITWTKNTDLNFYSYSVVRLYQSSYYEAAVIKDQNQTSFTDTWNNGAIGFACTYVVNVNNRYLIVQSNAVGFSNPAILINARPETTSQFTHPLLAASRPETYVLETNALKAVSSTTHEVLRTFVMDFNYSTHFALSKDESKLYITNSYSPNFIILNASNFDVIKSMDLNFNAGELICGRADRMYAINNSNNGSLKILDANTGSDLGEVDVNAPGGLLAITSDNNTLYVARPSYPSYQTARIYKLDISTDDPQVLLSKDASDLVRRMQLSSDNNNLFLIIEQDYPAPLNNFIDFWDVTTLTSAKKFTIPKQAYDFSANATSLFIISGEPGLQYFVPGTAIEYNIATTQIVNTWNFIHAPKSILCEPDNSGLYVYGDSFWYMNH